MLIAAITFVKLSVSQKQLQLFIKNTKFLRRAIIDIYTCKNDFRKNYFPKRDALSKYL